MNFLKNHPFGVEAIFEESLVLTFAIPKEQLQGMIPECLELEYFSRQMGIYCYCNGTDKRLKT